MTKKEKKKKREGEEKWTPLEAPKEAVLTMMKSVTLFYKMQDEKKRTPIFKN